MKKMLVYEFMPNGTLRDHLSSKAKVPLTFTRRVKIALGSARGILYLHTEANPPIFHRNIKATNILLDSNFTAKVADFGLSRLAPLPELEGGVPSHVSTVVKGTPGYLDPEYFLTHKLDKSDVYSLGVVFLEMLTRMHPISHGKNIVREVNIAYCSGMIFSIIDDRMGSYPSECIEKFINLALKCCREETDARPSMSEVYREISELEMISLAVHRNLLRIIGYCAAQNERLLVYPYMSNGSVASRLRGKPALDWNTRKRIAIGASRGLLYLHEQCDPKIIHRDVKAANVLLDDYREAVVGDFGLAKLLDHAESHVTTAVRGTVGHIAPEYLSTGQSSEKTDVFGFGILLLELITGMRALEFGKTVNQKGAMLEWVKTIQQEKKFELLVDKELGINYDSIEVGEMLQVALLCTQYLPANRPKMSDIVRMLEGDGLAEKWAASHNYIRSTSNSKSHSSTTAFGHEDIDHDHSSIFGMPSNMDDDDYDGNCMELSGPR